MSDHTLFFYGVKCSCVFEKSTVVCPVHGTEVAMLNTKQCLVHTCSTTAAGVCDNCVNGIIKLILLHKSDTLEKIRDLIMESPRYLPSMAQKNPFHPYTKMLCDKVVSVVKSRSEFIVQQDRVFGAAEWIKQQLDKKACGIISYEDMPALLGCTPKNVYHFKLSMYRGIEGYMNIGSIGVRKHTKYNCYSASRLMNLLTQESYHGVPIDELYQEDPNMHEFIRKLGNRVVCVNQRVYPCHASPNYASHFEENLYHSK